MRWCIYCLSERIDEAFLSRKGRHRIVCNYLSRSEECVQDGRYTARYCLKGCHRAVITGPTIQSRGKAGLQDRITNKTIKNSKTK